MKLTERIKIIKILDKKGFITNEMGTGKGCAYLTGEFILKNKYFSNTNDVEIGKYYYSPNGNIYGSVEEVEISEIYIHVNDYCDEILEEYVSGVRKDYWPRNKYYELDLVGIWTNRKKM